MTDGIVSATEGLREGGREGMRVPMPKRGKWLKIDRGTDGRERTDDL